MNKILILILSLLLFLSPLWAAELTTPSVVTPQVTEKTSEPAPALLKVEIQENLDEAKIQAREVGKNLLLVFHARWSNHSRRLMKQIASDQKLALFLADFITVVIDAEKCHEICRKFHVRAYPSTLVLNPEGEVLGEIRGVFKIQEYLDKIRKSIEEKRVE